MMEDSVVGQQLDVAGLQHEADSKFRRRRQLVEEVHCLKLRISKAWHVFETLTANVVVVTEVDTQKPL